MFICFLSGDFGIVVIYIFIVELFLNFYIRIFLCVICFVLFGKELFMGSYFFVLYYSLFYKKLFYFFKGKMLSLKGFELVLNE